VPTKVVANSGGRCSIVLGIRSEARVRIVTDEPSQSPAAEPPVESVLPGSGEDNQPPASSTSPRQRRLPRWVPVAAIALVAALGLFGGGFATGWITSNNVVTSATREHVSVPTSAPSIAGYDASVYMPDVRGLSPDDAQQVLADAGIDVATVTVTKRPAAGPSGIVIAQVPAFGAPSPATVSLMVSAPATVPTAVGQGAADVIKKLTDLGAQVQRVDVFVPDATVGMVTAISPAAGAALPAVVTLTVTAAPAVVNLATLSISGDCDETGSATMGGKTWTKAVSCDSSSSGDSATWSVNNVAGEVTGTVGISDSESSGSSATVQILGDGRVLGSYNLTSGTPVEFTLKTPGVTTLTVVCSSPSGTSPAIIVGDFSALGSSAGIKTLTAP
jgi:PASTA domain